MLKIYKYNGYTFQFEDGDVPDGAVLYEPNKEKKKAVDPSNKAKKTANKVRKAGTK